MANTRVTLEQLRMQPVKMDHARIKATTEDDIRRYVIEDGQDPDTDLRIEDSISPQVIRRRIGMTQQQFAMAIRVPLATLRNWEQGRVVPDPAARSLLMIVAKSPEASLRALMTDPPARKPDPKPVPGIRTKA